MEEKKDIFLNEKLKDNMNLIACYLHLSRASSLIKNFNEDISLAILELSLALVKKYDLEQTKIDEMLKISKQIEN